MQTLDIKVNPNALREINAIAADMMQHNVDAMLIAAKNNAPVRTGKLRDSLVAEKVSDNEYVIRTTCGYGAYVAMGSPNKSGDPFISDALDRTTITE